MTTPIPIAEKFVTSNQHTRMDKPPIAPLEPDGDGRRELSYTSDADIDHCWTCGACDNGCPVSIATGRLRPQSNVRMAVYGTLDELRELPDIWYCLSCRRCLQGCPNRVKPFELHRYLQNEAIRRDFFSSDFLIAYQPLFA